MPHAFASNRRARKASVALCAFALLDAAAEAQVAGEPPAPARETLPGLHVQSVRTGFDVVSGAGGNVLVWSGADGVVLGR